jgi:dipeptidyl aminopeptidase/acylaminoacyl peptidase
VVALQVVAPGYDGYRQALWLVPTDGSAEPRQLTLGARHDSHPRFSPDGRTLAFVSDRRPLLEEEPTRPTDPKDREDVSQVHLLPLDGGEARRLTDLPRGVAAFEWSPDGARLVVVSSSVGATHEDDARRRGSRRRAVEPGTPPPSDLRFIDRLDYMLNGAGFTYDRVTHLWLVDVASGTASRLTDGPVSDSEPTWSPDGTRIAFSSNRRRDPDLVFRQAIHVVDVATRAVTAITGGPRSIFGVPAWLPDGQRIVALGNRLEGRGGSRNDVWLFAADGSDATPSGGRDLSGRHDLMPGSTMNSDVTVGETSLLWPTPDGRSVLLTAPIDGSYELWRISTTDGAVERLTDGRHYLSSFDAVPGSRGRPRIAYLRSSATEPPDLWVQDGGGAPRRLTSFNAEVLAELELQAPIERHVSVDGQDVQGWYMPPAGAGDGRDRRRPLVTEIHGGPHTLYGWSLMWEFQVLAGSGIGVFYCNPRGSEGYGQAFNDGNHRDWGPGPMRDVIAGVDALVAEGLADPERLGLTGGSYGGYLTSWIIAHDDRFAAAMTCRSVADMGMLFLTGDISGGDWAVLEFDVTPWDDPAYYREISPISYARGIRTPLLIQHSERDLRTTIGQAEALFTVLRSLHRPVRLVRVPDETHELTRSGTPYRRVENVRIVLDWFGHYLLRGGRALPPLPRVRAGR